MLQLIHFQGHSREALKLKEIQFKGLLVFLLKFKKINFAEVLERDFVSPIKNFVRNGECLSLKKKEF